MRGGQRLLRTVACNGDHSPASRDEAAQVGGGGCCSLKAGCPPCLPFLMGKTIFHKLKHVMQGGGLVGDNGLALSSSEAGVVSDCPFTSEGRPRSWSPCKSSGYS